MFSLPRLSLQVVAYALFAAFIGYFSSQPNYSYADRNLASIKVSLSHAAARVEPCVQLTPEEIAQLAANMRRTETCQRQRLPLVLELDIDGQSALRLVAPPSGLFGDGPANIYRRLEVAPGVHTIAVRLRDTARDAGWDYSAEEVHALEAGRYFTVTFSPETGGFKFR